MSQVTRTVEGTASSATGSAVTTLVRTIANAIPQGASIVVAVYSSATGTGVTLADASGNTYTQDAQVSLGGSSGVLTVFRADNARALAIGDTITATIPSSTNAEIVVEYLTHPNGPWNPSFIIAASATGSSTAPASGVPATASANAIPAGGITLGFVAFKNAGTITETFTQGGSYTNGQAVQASGSSVTTGIFEEYLNAAGVPLTATGTLGHTDQWAAIALHYRPSNIWFYDYEAGSEFNGGDSFATLASGTDGVSNGTTTWAAASGAFDSTYLGRRINISKVGGNVQQVYLIQSVTNGTTLVLNGSPATATGQTWKVGGAFQTQKYGGNVGQNSPTTQNSGSGFLGTSQGINAGDLLKLKASTDPQDLGVTAVFTSNTNAATPTTNSKTFTLNTALTLDIDTGDAAWTASSQVTSTADATAAQLVEGTHSAKHAIGSSFTTGKASFHTTVHTDYSSKQQVCFWIFTSVAILAGQYSIRLCSDASGVTTVNNIGIPAIPSINTWTPVVVDTGGALGASIGSVALYVDSDQGAVNIWLDNIFAANAPGATALTLRSIVGKKTTPEPYWWPVRSVQETHVGIDGPNFTQTASLRGYYGVSETVELWKREPIAAALASSSQNEFQAPTGGVLLNAGPVNIQMSGGWDRTNMSTQSGQTWVTWSTGVQNGFVANNAYVSFDQLGAEGASSGFVWNLNSDDAVGSVYAVACTTGLNLNATSGGQLTGVGWAVSCGAGMSLTSSDSGFASLTVLSSSTGSGITFNGSSGGSLNVLVGTCSSCNNAGHGVSNVSGRVLIANGGAFSMNTQNGILAQASNTGAVVIVRGAPIFAGNGTASVTASFGGTVIIVNGTTTDVTAQVASGVDDCVIWDQFGGVATDYRQYRGPGTILTDVTTRHTASGVAWSLAPLATQTVHALNPLRLELARIAVAAGTLVTVSVYAYRNAGGITAQLCIPGGQLPGMPATDSVAAVAGVNAWEQLTLTFTPTNAGVVVVYGQAWGGTTLKCWFDDLARSQV